MRRNRRLTLEVMELRRLLAVMGPEDPARTPAWQSVLVELRQAEVVPEVSARSLLAPSSGRLDLTYEHALKGFSARLPREAIEALRVDPRVTRLELDLEMHTMAQLVPSGVQRIEADAPGLSHPIDGVDERIDVDVAIIDSGIDRTHPDLNVVGGYNATGGSPSNWSDGNGHGTHVAGIAAALDNGIGVVGVAPGARLWAVKVLGNNGSGSLSNIIKGIDWVTANASTIEVANMSLGGLGVSSIYREAIARSVGAGVVYVAAAGNDYRDILGGNPATASPSDSTSDIIPAAYPEVATISALADSDGRPGGLGGPTGGYADDTFADFSNFSNSGSGGQSWYAANNVVNNPAGLGIDLVLPGVNIYSTYRGGGYATMSGTSMAAPHAAGLAARYIAAHGRAADAAGVYAIRQALIDGGKAWRDAEYGLQFSSPANADSPDNHEENLGWAAPAGPVNQPPVAVDDQYELVEDQLLSIAAPGVLTGDSDPELASLTAELITPPAHGSLNLLPDGSFTYEPDANYYGQDSFVYRASDGARSSNLATVALTIAPVNDAPQAADQSVSLVQGQTESIALAGSDVDGDSLSYLILTPPVHGSLTQSGSSVSYQPLSPDYVGPDSFTYLVSDGSLSSDPATVTIDVLPAPLEVVVFADSFENGPSSNSNSWNGRWVEDAQNDFFRSSQRATDGSLSAEVDGAANNATLTLASGVDLSSFAWSQLSFDWLIESSFDAGEFLALDISSNGGSTWNLNVRQLQGNASPEDAWQATTVDLTPYASSNLKVRFRSTVSGSNEDANIDNVRIVGGLSAPAVDQLLAAGEL